MIVARIPHPATTNPRRWQVVRRLVLKRDGYRCRACGKAGRLEVDHIIPVVRGGPWWDAEGLQTLCLACHFFKSKIERMGPRDPELDKWKRIAHGLLSHA